MNSRINETSDTIDRATSRTICDAVGERLRQSLRPEALQPSSTFSIWWMNCADATRKPAVELAGRLAPLNTPERYFSHKRVAFCRGSGDKAACFQSLTYRSGLPDGS